MHRKICVLLLCLAWMGWFPAEALGRSDAGSSEILDQAQSRYTLPGANLRCHAGTDSSVQIEDVLDPAFDWICEDAGWSEQRETTWLTFEPRQRDATLLSLRHARFEAVTLYALRGGVLLEGERIASSQVEPALFGPFASVSLPAGMQGAERMIVRIDRPDLSSVGSEARLVASIDEVGFSRSTALLLAALAGLVLMPLLFDLSLFAVLRHRFMLSHAGMVAGMLLVLCASNGVFAALFDFTLGTLLTLAEVGYVVIVASAGLFIVHFVEGPCQTKATQRALQGAAILLLATSGLIDLNLPSLGWINQNLYMLGFLPMQLAVIFAVAVALAKRSRLVWFVIIGWLPAIVTGYDMIANGMGWQSSRMLGVTAPFYAMGFEVCVTGIGVIIRIMRLRRQRDDAIEEARILQGVSQRDPLTGLLNRRALQERFDELAGKGFSALALYDIDDFKKVNDDFGHELGDEVLVAMAKALAPGSDSIAIRMGGEEFVLLFRGPNALERAELRRAALTDTVRREVPQLPRPVTASMGIVLFEESGAAANSDFASLFARADKLLYAAKGAGKDTYQFEVFTPRPQDAASPVPG